MAAPESSHELSVVEGEVESSAPESTATPAPEPQPAIAEPQPTPPQQEKRAGAPWWLLVVVAVVGLVFFLYQYQRAEGLDGRVTSLTEELLATDQRLQIANGQIAAHQVHLERVRTGVADLSDQVAGLQALANRDPLAPAPPVAAVAEPAAVSEPVAEATPGEPAPIEAVPAEAQAEEAPVEAVTVAEAPQPVAGALTDDDGYYWRAEADVPGPAPVDAPPPFVDPERLSIIRGAVSTPFAER